MNNKKQKLGIGLVLVGIAGVIYVGVNALSLGIWAIFLARKLVAVGAPSLISIAIGYYLVSNSRRGRL